MGIGKEFSLFYLHVSYVSQDSVLLLLASFIACPLKNNELPIFL